MPPCMGRANATHCPPVALQQWGPQSASNSLPALVPHAGVRPSADGADVASPLSLVEWFMQFYEHKLSVGCTPAECVLKEGELLFVPVSALREVHRRR